MPTKIALTTTLVVVRQDHELLWKLLTQQCACLYFETMEMIGRFKNKSFFWGRVSIMEQLTYYTLVPGEVANISNCHTANKIVGISLVV